MKTSSQEKLHEGGRDEIGWQHIKEAEEEHFWLRKKAPGKGSQHQNKTDYLALGPQDNLWCL